MDAVVAVDVAILPPPHISEMAVALSALLPRPESQGLTLDATHLPHVTLAQQFVRTADLTSVTGAIGAVLRESGPLRLRIIGAGRGTHSVWMDIESTDPLRRLHAAVMDALLPFECPDGPPGAFAGGDPRPEDLTWVSQFRVRSSDERYRPHLTLGHASRLPRVEPVGFDAETIALCHLGRFCTCQAVLHRWTLTSSTQPQEPPDTRPRSA